MAGAASATLMGVGIPDKAAIVLGATQRSIAGVGTTQSGAATITVNLARLTTTGGATAFVLSTNFAELDEVQVYNSSATTALIYPQSGGNFDGGSTDASVSIPQNTSRTFVKTSSTFWRTVANTSASGAQTPSSVASTGAITSSSPSAGIGYATGAGGAVTQLTSRTTGVTLNTISGQITTNNASLAAEAAAEFTVTDSSVAIGDVVCVAIQSGTNGGNTAVIVSTVAAGSFKLKVCNNNAAGGTAETGAIIINFAVIKAVAA